MKDSRGKSAVMQGQETALRKPGVAQISILFSGTIILFILLGYRVQSKELYSGLLITEFGLILLPALFFVILSRFRFREVLRLNGTKAVNYPVIFGIMLFAVPLVAVFNLLNLYIVNSIFGKIIIEPIPVAENGMGLLLNIVVVACSAGICEEFLFRGVIQRGFETFGTVKAILMAAFLFSVTHLDFQKIFGTFLLGALIGFIVYRTNSLYCGMFAHFTNNAIAVVAGYISDKLLSVIQDTGSGISTGESVTDMFSAFSALPQQQLLFIFLIYGFMFIFAAIIFILLMYLLIRINPIRSALKPLLPNESKMMKASGNSAKGLLWLLPGFLMVVFWMYVQIYGFLGMENGITELFRYLVGAGA